MVDEHGIVGRDHKHFHCVLLVEGSDPRGLFGAKYKTREKETAFLRTNHDYLRLITQQRRQPRIGTTPPTLEGRSKYSLDIEANSRKRSRLEHCTLG
jgi:hypothetical protein